MFDLKLKTSVNFDFKKLGKELPKIAKTLAQSSVEASAEETRKSIDEERHGKPLSDAMKNQRRYGYHPRLKAKKPTTSIKPLKWTEYLYKNIKPIKKGLQIPDYGWYHHTGKTWGKVARKFIELKVSQKGLKDAKGSLKKAFKMPKKTLKEMKF